MKESQEPAGSGSALAHLLRQWRQRAQLTQEALAGRTGLGIRTIRRLEAGTIAHPRGGSLRLLVDALGLSYDERARFLAAARPGQRPYRPGPNTPRQLPAAVAGFVGRTRDLRALDELVAARDPTRTAPVVAVISGTAGVGKTALAVHWAHRMAERFFDGQLYVNLRGFDPRGVPTDPATAVRGFLAALDVPAPRIPPGLDAQAALYRSLAAQSRLLVLLDNARDAEQVRPLLPGAASCLTVVTSRSQLTGLVASEGALPVPLHCLSTVEARQLLGQRIGADRVTAESAAADEIATWCARLPLALAVVAARVAARIAGRAAGSIDGTGDDTTDGAAGAGRDLAVVAAGLRETAGRLDALQTADAATDVRTVFSWSYRHVTAAAARLFRLLGLHPGPDIGAPAVASLAGLPPRAVLPLLVELLQANLLTEPAPGRYALHDLLRAYAVEQAHRIDPEPERDAATRRALSHYLHTADVADRFLNAKRDTISLLPPAPGIVPQETADPEQALAWFEAEHLVMLAAVHHAVRAGHDDYTWQLAWSLWTFLDRRGHWPDQVATQHAAVDAAGRLADLPAQARGYRLLALAEARLGRIEEASGHVGRALGLSIEAGDRGGQGHCENDLARLKARQGDYADALEHTRRAIALYRDAGNRSGQADGLNNLGWYHAQLGLHEAGRTYCEQALALHRVLGNRLGQAYTWDSLGYIHHHLGDHRRALTCYRHTLDLYRDHGYRFGEAETLTRLGDTLDDAGDHGAARDSWQRATDILDELNHPDADRVRHRIEAAFPDAAPPDAGTGRTREAPA